MATSMTIPEFYADKNVFITGATGFIGKVLIEKLFRCCPNVKGIYCLIRPKRGKTAEERLKDMEVNKLFDNVEKVVPDFREKLHAVHGDIMEEELGISEEDKQMLHDEINVVFHVAATVKFDEPIRLAMELNVLAVRRAVHVFKQCKHLDSFVHVSTAYSNCNREYIEESIYPPPVEPQKVIDAMEWMTDDMLNLVTAKLLGPMPNTYTFTKNLAEHLLLTEAGDMPIAIVRPSIVTAAWKEPLPGWVDSMNGPSGLYVATGKGFLRSMMGDSNAIADLVPLDLPVNTIIAAGWHTAMVKPETPEPRVYHVTTGSQNPFTWGDVETTIGVYFKRNPLDTCYRRPRHRVFTPNSFLHDCWVLVSHLVPAYMADMGYMMMGKKPRIVNLYTKLHKSTRSLEYFTSHEWQWTYTNTDLLHNTMGAEDQKVFYLNSHALHWPTFMENCCLGTKTFVLKEELSGLPAARAHLKKLRNIRYLFNTALVVILWRLLIARSNLARNSWYFIMGLVFKFVRFFRITSTISQK